MFLNIGYSHEWWHAHHGINFDESFYHDPIKKLSTQDRMDEWMRSRFAKWGIFEQPNNTKVVSSPVIAIEPYGHRFIPAMFGVPLRYAADQPPWAHPVMLDDAEILSRKPIMREEFAAHPFVREIMRQHKLLKNTGRPCSAQQNLGSVTNSMIYMRGSDLFYDFHDKPEVMHHLLELITEMMIVAYDYFCEVDGYTSPLGIGNCSVAMISPRVYREFCFPNDMRLMNHARLRNVPFSIHQDSRIDPYIPMYQPFDYLSSFDIGCDSDVHLFRRAFPEIEINIFLYTGTLHSHSAPQLHDLILEMAEQGKPYSRVGFSVYDIDPGVPDEKIDSICDAWLSLKENDNHSHTF